MRTQSEFAARDRSRRPESKRCSMSRREDQRRKSAMLFLAFAFPAELTVH